MLTINSLKKIAWAFLPIIIGLAVIGVILLTDLKASSVVMRVKIEILVMIFAALVSAFLLTLTYFKLNSEHTRSRVEKEQYEQKRDEHRRFIQRLDHELKNPLTAIHLGLENLKQDNPNDSSITELQGQTKRMSQLTGDLRKLASFDQQKLELAPISIVELLSETKELVDDLDAGHETQLTLPAAPWPVPNVLGDRDLLQLAIYNVIENSIKYSDKDDLVEIRASDDREWVKIEISDTGIGINQSDIGEVYEELYRANNGRHRTGTGIGLSLVKRIIERHKGKIQLESKESIGTRVTISLPITQRQ